MRQGRQQMKVKTPETHICRDWKDARPGCLKVADPRYTMYFDDIGEPPIYWCAHCGADAHEMDKVISKAFSEGGDRFKEAFEKAIKEAEKG